MSSITICPQIESETLLWFILGCVFLLSVDVLHHSWLDLISSVLFPSDLSDMAGQVNTVLCSAVGINSAIYCFIHDQSVHTTGNYFEVFLNHYLKVISLLNKGHQKKYNPIQYVFETGAILSLLAAYHACNIWFFLFLFFRVGI